VVVDYAHHEDRYESFTSFDQVPPLPLSDSSIAFDRTAFNFASVTLPFAAFSKRFAFQLSTQRLVDFKYEGHPFIAMELVPGTTLERLMKEEPRLELARALHVAREIALALDYAHMKGVVHRDLKPDNVMVLPDGSVKVMDYGIARQLDTTGLTASNTYLGTPLYSAPEALTPSEVGPASDLYSLGIILYRCLTGAPQFVASTPLEVLHEHAYEPPPPFPPGLGIAPEVFGLVLELTAKRASDRYRTAEHFVRDLDTILTRL